ncbi:MULTISPECIES: ABC transporter permease [Clostridia]|uniref:ABC transporter permease n=1 Tax=Clostridia TaxID=186801 RepID=UPI000EA3C54E|nr:ABC transporter permease [Clostridium sp. 1xD42-85]NBJ68120.1 bacitracin ABC transporter permease [Roseburia sp. 1XD42-34]RKI81895.1 bacitracin ABC transporter permease [Clostridium sp. 1xD42-85]
MNKFATSASVEYKKFFHSKIPLITLIVCMLVPFIGGFFMFVLKNPDFAEHLGLISNKAQLIGTADWPSYLSLLAQAISIGGLIVFGFIMSWIFGREYSDRTIKDLLALPISRHMVVLSKFVVAVCWCFILSIVVLALGLLVGIMVNIPGWSQDTFVQDITIYGACSTLTILVSTPVALIASIGRGYLPPLGFMIFTLVLAQIVAVSGYGQFFPWAIPALLSGGEKGLNIEEISLVILLLTSSIGLISTMLWWKIADPFH